MKKLSNLVKNEKKRKSNPYSPLSYSGLYNRGLSSVQHPKNTKAWQKDSGKRNRPKLQRSKKFLLKDGFKQIESQGE